MKLSFHELGTFFFNVLMIQRSVVLDDNPEYLLIHTTTPQSPKPNVYIKIKTTIFDLHLKTKDLKTSQFINFQNTDNDNLKNLKVEFQFIIKARKTD